jgi:hypothetical protein
MVLADLRAKRDQIDKAILAIEMLRGQSVGGTAAVLGAASAPPLGIDDPGAFLGMTIADAAKKLLAARRKQMNNPEMAVVFKKGGLHLNSKDPVNTIGAVLTRRANEVGDIVKVGRGTWGLKEWYPNRSFRKKTSEGGDEKDESEVS